MEDKHNEMNSDKKMAIKVGSSRNQNQGIGDTLARGRSKLTNKLELAEQKGKEYPTKIDTIRLES